MKHRSLAIRLVFSCLLCSSSTSASDSVCAGQPIGSLRPSDIPPAPVFSSWESNYTVDLPTGVSVAVAEGVLNGPGGRPARFAVLPGVVQRDEVAAILELVNSSTTPTFDADPDSVDGLPTHEFFVEDVHKELHTNGQIKIDSDPRLLAHRRPLREALKTRIHAFLRERVTPLVHARYPEACVGAPGRTCRPCYMLVRRYLPEERRSHGSHHDGHALVTVVVSLTDHGSEYEGGLYVGAGHGGGGRRVVGLSRGDAVMHQSDLLHGVKVESGERWSLIIWYRDSSTCEEHGLDWFKQCAEEGDPTCQHMYSTKVGPVPGSADPAAGRLRWAKLAAEGGSPVAMIKLGRAYLKRLPSSLKLDFTAAAKWFRRAAEASGEPDAHYALAQMMLDGQLQPPGGEGGGGQRLSWQPQCANSRRRRRGTTFSLRTTSASRTSTGTACSATPTARPSGSRPRGSPRGSSSSPSTTARPATSRRRSGGRSTRSASASGRRGGRWRGSRRGRAGRAGSICTATGRSGPGRRFRRGGELSTSNLVTHVASCLFVLGSFISERRALDLGSSRLDVCAGREG